MPGYFSEVAYHGNNAADFIEIALPKGTDVSGYTVQVYDTGGNLQETLTLGSIQQTVDQKDVYLVDSGTSGFAGIKSSDSVALIDDLGNVVQFVCRSPGPP